MELRELRRQEHGKTRPLWEKIFTEDTEVFLDYYYGRKAKKNKIFVMEEEQEIIAMLQLNPYCVRMREKCFNVNYIVAVATDVRYRSRGIMGKLLRYALLKMYEKKEPFTFLMPAAEGIYYPYDFRFVYRQMQGTVVGQSMEDMSLELRLATEKDCKEIARFANRMLRGYEVVSVRDAEYYETLLEEQKSENGGIVMAKRSGQLVGVLCYAKGEKYEFREPLFEHKEDLRHAVFWVTGDEKEKWNCNAWGEEKETPIIMARIVHLETFLKTLSLRDHVDFYLKIQDDFLKGNHGVFHIVGNREQGICVAEGAATEIEHCGEIAIGELTSILFGYESIEKYSLSEKLKENLQKFVPFSKVFLNEVV